MMFSQGEKLLNKTTAVLRGYFRGVCVLEKTPE